MAKFIVELEHVDFSARPFDCVLVKFNSELYNDDLFQRWQLSNLIASNNASVIRKAEFLAGRYCAKTLLLKFGSANFEVIPGPHRQPLWPEGFTGSITHNKNYAGAAIFETGSQSGVGIDIEEQVSEKTFNEIKHQILNDCELNYIRQCTEEMKLMSFTLIFSVKEAFFKAIFPYHKEYFGFDAITVNGIDLKSKTIHFTVEMPFNNLRDIRGKHFAFFELLDHKTYLTMFTF